MSAVVGLHYQPISREDAFQKIAAHFNALASPDEAAFYSTVKKMLDNMFIGGLRRGTMTGCWISVLQKQGVCFLCRLLVLFRRWQMEVCKEQNKKAFPGNRQLPGNACQIKETQAPVWLLRSSYLYSTADQK